MNVFPGGNAGYHNSHGFGSESACAPAGTCAAFPPADERHFANHHLAAATEMDRYVFTRASLANPSAAQKPVAILTGAWPHGRSKSVVELDCAIDRRFVHLDREAVRLAEVAGSEGKLNGEPLSAPWINVLALRYYMLRLLRVVEYFTKIQPPKRGERIGVVADNSDRDDVAMITAICRRVGADCQVEWHGDAPEADPRRPEREEWWRRMLRRLATRKPYFPEPNDGRVRVVLCGNPRFLDALCSVLLDRECTLWWLYDRLAVKPLFRWHKRGVGQLTCQDEKTVDRHSAPVEIPALQYRGVDLRTLVATWLAKRLESRWEEQQRWQEHVDRHFRRIKPHLLVMDEDATPMKRIALAAVRRYGGKSYVVQHGAPTARFGFAPMGADGLFAWGRSSREQLVKWEVPSQRVHITGSPVHDELYEKFRKLRHETRRGSSPRILLLATVPPRDVRPDLIEMNLNSRTYGEMIEAAFAAVASIPGATLVVKPHPRAKDDAVVLAAKSRHPGLRVQERTSGPLAKVMLGIDCVLSCLSSAGIEATLAGVPVIQLVPRGAGEVLCSVRWGLYGSASHAKELAPMLRKALQERRSWTTAELGDVFAGAAFWGHKSTKVPDAAMRIADLLIGRAKQNTTMSRTDEGQGRSMALSEA